MRYDNFKFDEIKNNKNGYVLTGELAELGFYLVKHNKHPRGWTLNITQLQELHWSSSIKGLDSYITRHKEEIITKYGESK